jgi:hypothetical protein
MTWQLPNDNALPLIVPKEVDPKTKALVTSIAGGEYGGPALALARIQSDSSA